MATQRHRWVDLEDEEAGANRQSASLAAMAVLLLLIVLCLGLIRVLHHCGAMEDCVLSGRSNCEEVVVER